MKTVYLLRHAKSDWSADYGADHDRPLSKRGRKAATAIGRFLAAAEELPDRIIASSAVRARTTVERAMKKGDWPEVPYVVTQDLYEADPEDLLAVLRAQPEAAQSVMLVGHEPTFSDTLSRLIGGGGLTVPTACIARVDFAVPHWQEVFFGGGTLLFHLPPRLLG